MAGPALAIQWLLIAAFILFLLALLYIVIKKRRRLIVSVPLAVLLLSLLLLAFYIYKANRSGKDKVAKKFLGDYKLTMLDRKNCENCIVRLNSNYYYDIITNGKITGHGKWGIGSAIDIPGYFLEIENGPSYMIWEHERKIDFIDRTTP